MNELYERTIEVNGVVYHYDPDQDIYYRRYGEMSRWDRWSPLIVIVLLTAVAVWVEYFR